MNHAKTNGASPRCNSDMSRKNAPNPQIVTNNRLSFNQHAMSHNYKQTSLVSSPRNDGSKLFGLSQTHNLASQSGPRPKVASGKNQPEAARPSVGGRKLSTRRKSIRFTAGNDKENS